MSAPDVLLVSLGSTAGLRASDEAFAVLLRNGGATVGIVRAEPQRQVRTLALTDLLWARASAAAARRSLAAQQPRAIVYSSVTAALLWPQPGAIASMPARPRTAADTTAFGSGHLSGADSPKRHC